MWVFTRNSRLLSVVVLAVTVGLAVPATAFAQGWGRGRKQDKSDKKCEKFVNCHDARDGRWDGRGPNRTRLNDRWDDRSFDDRLDRNRRFRNRDYNDDYRRFQQRRMRNFRYYNRANYRDSNYSNNPYGYQQGGVLNGLLDLFR